MYQNNFNKNVVIKKNFFGHKWVLQINEIPKNSKKKLKSKTRRFWRCMTYFSVILCLGALLGLGVFYTLDTYFWQGAIQFQNDLNLTRPGLHSNKTKENNITDKISSTLLRRKYRTHEKQIVVYFKNKNLNNSENFTTVEKLFEKFQFCQNCTTSEICLKSEETDKPECIEAKDLKDPTGCGGLCQIATEYCKILDRKLKVVQCLKIENNTLQCEDNEFSCGNRCVSMEKRCDGWIDCTNKSDELQCECNLSTHFQCGNSTSCIEMSKKCDGVVQCWDWSDETNCQKAPKCPKDHVQCLNGQCIPKEQFCDRKTDCKDRSDEPKWCQ